MEAGSHEVTVAYVVFVMSFSDWLCKPESARFLFLPSPSLSSSIPLYLADGNDVSCTSYSDPHPTLHGLLCKDGDGSFVSFPADAILNIISRGRQRDIAGRRGFSFWFRCPYYSGVPFGHLRWIMVSSSRCPAACCSTAPR